MSINNDIFDLKNCRLCPRRCGADRYTGRGFCGAPAKLTAARSSLHLWEEPCIAGEKGAGTVFFTYCQLGCVYCQNYAISSQRSSGVDTPPPFGKEISVRELAASFLRLQSMGAATIDLVTPTHYAPHIIEALRMARQGIDDERLTIPAVWNSSGYETPEMVKAIAADIDIFMPDFKYFSRETALRYSNAPDYPERAMESITAMVETKGAPVYFPLTSDEEEPDATLLKSGVIIRHLVLPGHRHESIALVQELYKRFEDSIILSLMNQYTPIAGAAYLTDYPELSRKLTKFEYDSVVNAALDAGFTSAFIQQGGTVSESFIPIFDGRGL
ncbi:MAG: radical SAM protein [Selenomonadaceae bacterium]|nr:radical SAM protein [Selenomonadaceae bacterium]